MIQETINDQELYIILLGKCGSGKSSLANFLSTPISQTNLNTNFISAASLSSVTKQCQELKLPFSSSNFKKIHIVDTPGFSGLDQSEESSLSELKSYFTRLMNVNPKAVCALGLVVSLNERINQEDLKNFGLLGTVFGMKFYSHSFLCFTHSDRLSSDVNLVEEEFEKFLGKVEEDVKSFLDEPLGPKFLVNSSKNRYIRKIEAENRVNLTSEEFVKILDVSGIAGKKKDLELRGKKARRMRQKKRIEEQRELKNDDGIISSILFDIKTTFYSVLGINQSSEKEHIV
eukprot:maker-scaffold_61-snap-gene-0.10-mRNA-1 protein AED:0.00 eAED:0.00 QI:108/1/1/1/0/0/2/325/286